MTIEHKRLGSILNQRMMAMCSCKFTGEWSFTCSCLQGKHSILCSQLGCPERHSCSLFKVKIICIYQKKVDGWVKGSIHGLSKIFSINLFFFFACPSVENFGLENPAAKNSCDEIFMACRNKEPKNIRAIQIHKFRYIGRRTKFKSPTVPS